MLTFSAPEQVGVYPYICTYPGHWRRMFGALYVVEDYNAYQRDPQGYLAAHPLPVRDDLLKFNRPLKEWKLEELKAMLGDLETGRSFGLGKELFTVANCVACHQLNNTGRNFGPSLAELDPKRTPEEVLRDILEPSHRINEKYQTYTLVVDGELVTGLIVEETDDTVSVVNDPLANLEPRVVDKDDIEERVKSETSLMPTGLLDRLTEEEIMELLAYIVARGSETAPIYHK